MRLQNTAPVAVCHPEITDLQLRELAHRLRQYRFTILVVPSELDADRLLRTRLMPLLSRRSSDLGRQLEPALPTQVDNRRAASRTESSVFFESWRAMQLSGELNKRSPGQDERVCKLIVMTGLGDVLREAGSGHEEANRWLKTLAQAHWALDRHDEPPVQLLLVIDQAALPLLEILRLQGLPVDESKEFLAPTAPLPLAE